MRRCEPVGAFATGRLLPLMPCDWCDSTESVEPQFDPWGGLHGYQCERCIDAAQERSCETPWQDAMEAKYPLLTGTERY
jgi:hypothetical protein